MPSKFDVDEFAFGTRTPEGVDRFVSRENLTGIPEISNNERYRVNLLLADNPTEDAAAIRQLYGIVE